MEIDVASERAFAVTPALTADVLKERAWDKKVHAFSSGLGGLLMRPKAEEVEIIYQQMQYQPFWHIVAGTHYAYERARTYRVPVQAPDVRRITLNGQTYDVAAGHDAKEPRGANVHGTEYCEDDLNQDKWFDAIKGHEEKAEVCAPMLKAPAVQIADLGTFAPTDAIVIPPQVRAMNVVRTVMGGLFKGVQADRVLEERTAVTCVDLYFRPVYTVEYALKGKDKKAVLEFDGVSGEMHTGGFAVREQLRQVLSQDLLFDVTADAIGMFVPGGSIAVKLARAGARKALDED